MSMANRLMTSFTHIVILNCVLIYNAKMREQGHGTDEVRIGSQGIESETQLLLNGIKGGKDAIGEILLTQLVPQMLHRIHLILVCFANSFRGRNKGEERKCLR